MTTLFIFTFIPWLIAISGIGIYKYFGNLSVSVIPILGFVAILVFACSTSALLNLSGSNSTLSASLLLSVLGFFAFFKLYGIEQRKKMLSVALIFSSLYYFIYLIFLKFKIFFGVYNYDFFYNIQDSLYLQKHSIYDFDSSAEVFPLGWSADPMGRFAPSLLISLMNSFSDDALRWAGASFVLVITLSCFGFVVFFREYFQKKNFFLIFLIFGVVVLNSLTLFAWESNLLGQISGLPVLLLLFTIFAYSKFQESQVRVFGQLVFLLVGLYWIYPAMFLIATPLAILILIRIFLVQGYISGIRNTLFFFASLIFTGYPNFEAASSRLLNLIFFTESNSQTAPKSGELVFNQFSSWFGPLLSLGYLKYPNRFGTIGTLILYVFLLIILGLLIRRLIKSSVGNGLRSRLYPRTDLQVLIFYLVLIYLFMFVVLRSNYFLFKVSTWFSPLLVGIFLIYSYNSASSRKNFVSFLLILFVSPIILSGVATGVNYLQNPDGSFPLAKNKLENEFVEKFVKADRTLVLNLPTSEESAWIALSAGAKYQSKFYGLTAPKQVLANGFAVECAINRVLLSDAVIVTPRSKVDIFPSPNFIYGSMNPQISNSFEIKSAKDLRLLLVSNSGLFNPNKSEGWPFFKGSFYRWSNGFLCISAWSPTDSLVDIKFPIQEGPDWNNSNIGTPSDGILTAEDRPNGLKLMTWEKIQLKQGWNSLSLQVSKFPSYISTSSINPDFRPLSFAIGEIVISNVATTIVRAEDE